MTSLTHMVAGLAITQVVPDPALSLPLAFASHFVLDTVPHNDYVYAYVGKRWKHLHESPMSQVILYGGALLAIYLSIGTITPLVALAGAFFGMSPDAISALLKRAGFTKNWFYRFHHWVHTRIDLGEVFYNAFTPNPNVSHPTKAQEFKDNLQKMGRSSAARVGWFLESTIEIAFLFLLLLFLR